jgi:hypothetical protein
MTSDFARSSSKGGSTAAASGSFAAAVAAEIITPRRRKSLPGGLAVADARRRGGSRCITPLGGCTPPVENSMPRRRRASCSDAVALSGGMPPEQAGTRPDLRFDVLRLREWFNKMDQDRCGHVSKGHFMGFVGSQPQLLKLLVDGQEAQLSGQQDGRLEEIVRRKKLSRTWTELSKECSDEDKMEWSSFVDFFRQRGMLLEYKTKDNPKERLAAMLADVHAKPLEQRGQTLDEFERLKKSHLQGQQQREVGQALEESVHLEKNQVQGQQKGQPGIQEQTGLPVLSPLSSRNSTKTTARSQLSSRNSTRAAARATLVSRGKGQL